jgi:flagella basal body P-ring formation protein FlgA
MKTHRLAWLSLFAMSCAWSNPPAAESACAHTPAAQQALLAHVLARVQPALAVEGVQLELLPIGQMPAMAWPQVRLVTQGLRSRVAVELQGKSCGHERASTVTVWFKVRALREVWVYGRNARPGRALAEAEPLREQIDVAALQVRLSDLPENLDGLWLTEAANAGMPILNRHLQAEPLVKRDAVVSVIVYGPGLMLRTQGKVMRAGVLGETVPVLVEGAESSLLAVVSGNGEVHVQR